MTCEQFADGNLADALDQGMYLEAVICPYDLQIGTLFFGLLIYGGVMTSLYVRTQSFVMPFVVTILGGTIAVSRLPSPAHQILGMGVLTIITISIMLVYLRMQNVA